MEIKIPWYYILPAGLGSTAIACATLNTVVLPVMFVIRWCQGLNQTKIIIKTSLWLTLWVSELLNSTHYIVMFTMFCELEKFELLPMYINVVSSITTIVYATGLIGLSVEMILRPYTRRSRGITHVAVAVGCFFAPWCLALTLVLPQYNWHKFPVFYIYDAWVSVFNLVLNTLALALSCHVTCSPVMRRRFAATRLVSARIQPPGESGSESLASQGVNQDFPRNYGSINSGFSNVEIEEQKSVSGTALSVAEVDSSRLPLENSLTSPEATSSTLPLCEDALSGCVGPPRNVVGSNPIDHVESQNHPPPHHVMVSPQEETTAEETTSPQTPLLPQTDSNISALDDDPKKESVNILIVTITSAISMYPFWIIKLIFARSNFTEGKAFDFYMITLQLSCIRSLVLALILIYFLPTSVRRLTRGFEYKILF